MPDTARAIADALGVEVVDIGPLTGGCVGEVYRVKLADGRSAVAKVDNGKHPQLDIEGFMLAYLDEHSRLPVPAVYHSAPELLVMELLPGNSRFSSAAERHAAHLLVDLHGITSPKYGLERDTLIGGLHQPNSQADRWIPFFREHRLYAMARQALDYGRFGADTMRRIEKMGERLDDLLLEPDAPSLLHGDIWSANVLADGARITGFIDPAVYYGHPEIELAFITLFSTFGEPFFKRYAELRPIAPDFFEVRRDIYNLYPLLVHVRLFGGGYLGSAEAILRRHGC